MIYRGYDISVYCDTWGGWVWELRKDTGGKPVANGIASTQSKAEDAAMNAVDRIKRGPPVIY